MGIKKEIDNAKMKNEAIKRVTKLESCPGCHHGFNFLEKTKISLSLNPKCPNCKKSLKDLILNDFESQNKETIKRLKKTLLVGIDKEKIHLLSNLTKNILDDEEILAIVFGNGNLAKNMAFDMDLSSLLGKGDFLIVTSDRIFIIKGGIDKLLGGSFGGQKKSFYYSDITSVDTSSNLGRYRLEITYSGQTGKQGGLFSGNVGNENIFNYTKYIKDGMEKVESIINKKIREVKRR